MKLKFKNWIVFGLHLQFGIIITIIIIFTEFIWLYQRLDPLNLFFSETFPLMDYPTPLKLFISIGYVALVIINLICASFSLYAFIFKLDVLGANPAKTAPVCAIVLNISLFNMFFYHFTMNKHVFFNIFSGVFPFSIYYYIPNSISNISEIFISIDFLSFLLCLQFGISGIRKRKAIKHNLITNAIHVLLIINGLLPIGCFLVYTSFFNSNILSIISSGLIAFTIACIFILYLKKKKIDYPIEAIARWREEKLLSQKVESVISNT